MNTLFTSITVLAFKDLSGIFFQQEIEHLSFLFSPNSVERPQLTHYYLLFQLNGKVVLFQERRGWNVIWSTGVGQVSEVRRN